jgi:hypothetical protein
MIAYSESCSDIMSGSSVAIYVDDYLEYVVDCDTTTDNYDCIVVGYYYNRIAINNAKNRSIWPVIRDYYDKIAKLMLSVNFVIGYIVLFRRMPPSLSGFWGMVAKRKIGK